MPFTIPRKTPRTLLFYLASRGNMISRSELLPLFWPEETDPIARLRLRETLNKLKKGLPQENLLVSRADQIGLSFDAVFVDLLEFNKLISQIGQLPWKIPTDDLLPEPLYQKLTQAIQLWRSPTILAGAKLTSSINLDNWFDHLVNYNENLYCRIVERLSDHEATTGNFERALELAQQAVLHREHDEELQAHVLRLMIQMGLIKEARVYFKEIQTLLFNERNTQLGPELMQLYQQIRSDTRPLNQNHEIRWDIHSSIQVPFVGRQKQLNQLHQAFHRGGGLILVGESGLGKTRLLQEFHSQLQPTPRLLLAKCRPTESSLPFQPLVDVIRQNTLSKEWLSIPRAWANHLKVLFPELNNLRSDLTPLPEIDPEQARSQLFEALRQLFLIFCKSQRLLMILDDGQWIDEASQDAIMYLVGRDPFEKQALAIIAARPDDRNPRIIKHLALAHNLSGTSVLQLPQMDLNEIEKLSTQVLGVSPSARFVAHLAHETGGNPFYILETLHAIINQQPSSDLENLEVFPLTDNIFSLIKSRLQLLSRQARSLIDTAAIIGSEFQVSLLTRASDLTEAEVALALDELIEENFIARSDELNQPPKYRFLHDQFREVALLMINSLREQIAHRKIGFALMRDENERFSQSAVLADHFEKAEEWCLAFEHWVIAGRRARQLYAISDASRAFQNAENLIEGCWGSLSEQQIYSLYKDWGEMAYACNDTQALQKMNANLVSLGDRLDSPLLKGTAFIRLGNACFSSAKLEEGLEYTRLAIDLLSSTDNLYQLTNARTNLGVFYYMTGHVIEALQVLEKAAQEVEGKDERELIFLRASLSYEIGMGMFLNGQPHKSIEYGLLCLQDNNAIHDLEGIASSYSVLALTSYYLGNYFQGFNYSQLGIESAGQSQSWRMLGYLYDYRAMLEYVTGNLDAMLEYVEQAIELGQRIGYADIYATGYRLISDVFYLINDHKKSLEYLQLAFVENQKSFIAFDILYRTKSLLFSLERNVERLSEIQNMIQIAQASGLIIGKLLAQIALMMAYQELKQWEDAKVLANEIKSESLTRGYRAFVIAANLILANCEWQTGHQKLALKLLNESIQEAESLPIVWLEIRGRVLLAKYSQQIGQPAEANRLRIIRLIQTLHQNCQKSLFKTALNAYTVHIEELLD